MPSSEPLGDAARWARMEALLQGLQLDPVESQRVVAVEEGAGGAGDDRVAEALEAIDQRLRILEAVGRAGERSGVRLPLDRAHSVDVGQIVALGDLANSDRPEAMRQLMLLTPEEAVERFGFPTSVDGGAHGIWWTYRDLGPGAEPYSYLQLQFLDGLLTNFEL